MNGKFLIGEFFSDLNRIRNDNTVDEQEMLARLEDSIDYHLKLYTNTWVAIHHTPEGSTNRGTF
jgi:hypothetical protein